MKRIALFARPPVVGRVKTRLSPALPPKQACELYEALLSDTVQQVEAADGDERTVWWSEPPTQENAVVLPRGWREAQQAGADLGERMRAAFESLVSDGGSGVIVGSDCPALRAAHIEAAFTALESHDAVFGPATDGGYYLIGLTAPRPELLDGIMWSSSSVLGETLARATTAGLRVHTLEPLDDLDTPADLVRWIGRTAGASDGGEQRSRAVLQALGLAPGR